MTCSESTGNAVSFWNHTLHTPVSKQSIEGGPFAPHYPIPRRRAIALMSVREGLEQEIASLEADRQPTGCLELHSEMSTYSSISFPSGSSTCTLLEEPRSAS